MSDAMGRHLKRNLESEDSIANAFVADWTRIHLLCIETVDEGFRGITNSLDKRITEIVSGRLCATPEFFFSMKT